MNVSRKYSPGIPLTFFFQDLLDPLRVDVNFYIPSKNPFTYEGTNGPWDEECLRNTFLNTQLINIDLPSTLRSSTIFSLYPGVPAVSPDACQLYQDTSRLKVIKAGVLNKKDDLAEGGKKALSRKWKTWGVILSDSQLLFCRDPTLVPVSYPLPEPSVGDDDPKFRPDDTYSLKDSIAVYDHSYKKVAFHKKIIHIDVLIEGQYNHTFRFVLPDGRHLLLQAANNEDLQHWISCINYACTFKSASVRIRPTGVSDRDIRMTGAAASTPHLRDMHKQVGGQRPRSVTVNEFVDSSMSQAQNRPGLSTIKNRVDGLHSTQASPEGGNADLFKAMFKADLAILTSPVDKNSPPMQDYYNSESSLMYSHHTSDNPRGPLRSQIVMKKIRELDTKITALQLRLDSDERHARNIAILTPFRKTTRSKLLTVVQNLAKPLMRMRLEMERLQCYRAVLLGDLVSESRLRIQPKQTTLRAATDPLRLRRPKTAPTMLQTYDDLGKQSSTPASLSNSTSGSFHSARESAFDWPPEVAGDSSLYNSPKPSFHKVAPAAEHEDMLFGTPSSRSQKDLKDRPYRDSSSEIVSQGDDDEQAEDWNKTRVAKRVSLIHIPSDFTMSTRLKAVFEGKNDQG